MIMIGQSQRLAQPMSRRTRRWIGGVLALLLVVVVAGSLLAVVRSDPYGASRHGCVNVSAASGTGGSTLHACGAAARRWCVAEAPHRDPLAVLVHEQCDRAGYGHLRPTATG